MASGFGYRVAAARLDQETEVRLNEARRHLGLRHAELQTALQALEAHLADMHRCLEEFSADLAGLQIGPPPSDEASSRPKRAQRVWIIDLLKRVLPGGMRPAEIQSELRRAEGVTVSRSTLQRALNELARYGIVTVVEGVWHYRPQEPGDIRKDAALPGDRHAAPMQPKP